jgi:hypothetical protein
VTCAASLWKAQPDKHGPMARAQHTQVHHRTFRPHAISLPLSFLQTPASRLFSSSRISRALATYGFPESVAAIIIPRYPR